MGNIITNTSSLTTSLDLADGNAKVKKDLSVVGKSTFTGDSTFNGNFSVTNGKFNNVNVPTLDTDVAKLKTDMTTVNTTLTSVSAGSFTGKAISGATDVTATGTGTFNSVKTSNIDINGDITSTTGKSYIKGITSGTSSSLSLTNGMPSGNAANAQVNLQSDGVIQLTHGTGKSINLGSTIKVVNNALQGVGVFETTGMMTAGGKLTGNRGATISGVIDNTGYDLNQTAPLAKFYDIETQNIITSTGQIKANGGITVPTGKSVITDGLTVNGTSSHTGVSTFSEDLNAKNIVIGTNKWVIEEVSDANKGKRLCFGKANAQGVKTYWTCMNDTGNLELF